MFCFCFLTGFTCWEKHKWCLTSLNPQSIPGKTWFWFMNEKSFPSRWNCLFQTLNLLKCMKYLLSLDKNNALAAFCYEQTFPCKNNQKQICVKLFILHNRASLCELTSILKHPRFGTLDLYQVVDWIRQCELNIREHCWTEVLQSEMGQGQVLNAKRLPGSSHTCEVWQWI